MTIYAAKTEVPSEKTRAEIERLVTKYGATRFMSGWEDLSAAVLFEMSGRRVRFSLPMPDPSDRKYTHVGDSAWAQERSKEAVRKLVDQATRSAWRCLLLVIKAKLEAVESGITTFEDEFLAHLVLPNGQTVGEWAIPMIAEAYENGLKMPPMLPAGPT